MSDERLAAIRRENSIRILCPHCKKRFSTGPNGDIPYLLELLDQREKQIERMKVDHQEEIRDMMRDARDAAAEARWEAKQDDDYGSY